MRKSKKKKYSNPDEYFQMGPFEIARFDKVVTMRNNMSKEEHLDFMNKIAQQSVRVENDIDMVVLELREAISQCNPLKLLQFGYNQFFQSLLGITSEVQLTSEAVYSGRELEYIQSVIASSPIKGSLDSSNDQSENFFSISEKIHKLYRMNQQYFIYYTAKERANNPDISPEIEKFIIESQMAMFYRGDRYQVYEIEHLKDLLEPHNEVFFRLFNLTIDRFIDGLRNIQNSLSNGMSSAFGDLESMISQYESFMLKQNSTSETLEETNEMFKDLLESDPRLNTLRNGFMGKFLGYDLFDLSILTEWPEELQRKLSWNINEDKSFYDRDIYAGWPIIEMPIFQKPFICIENKCYCFDYYNLFDNIYRVIQKLIIKEESSYLPLWSEKQKNVSEGIVAELLTKILPACNVLQSNYYPINNSLKQCAENDILIIYDDNLFIIEVKAGSYTYTSPTTDIASHVESLKTLIGKADTQAARTLNYLQSADKVKVYDKDKQEKFEISLSDYTEITTFCVTLDNFNEFAAKAEKISFISLKENTVVISIDDLRVYADYFESPSTFLHYLKQRKMAADIKKLALNDELDHLGMYISHNVYSITADQMDDGKISWLGYREKLDEYFSSLFIKDFSIEKPTQELPSRLREIINIIDISEIKGRSSLALFLLDLSGDARTILSNHISTCLEKQKQKKKMFISSTFGDVRYSLFCHQTGIESLTDLYTKDYVLSTMINGNEESRLELHLYYGIDSLLQNIRFFNVNISDIPFDRTDELRLLSDQYAESRIESYKRQSGIKKVGRNEKCPCGSSSKYKNCHGK